MQTHTLGTDIHSIVNAIPEQLVGLICGAIAVWYEKFVLKSVGTRSKFCWLRGFLMMCSSDMHRSELKKRRKRNYFKVKNESQWGTSKISDTKQQQWLNEDCSGFHLSPMSISAIGAATSVLIKTIHGNQNKILFCDSSYFLH